MKALHLTKYAPSQVAGGIETYIDVLSRGLAKLDVESIILCCGKSEAIRKVNSNITEITTPTSFKLAASPFSFKLIKKLKQLAKEVDMIILHFPWPYGDLAILLSQIKTPIVIVYHNDIVRQKNLKRIYTPLYKKICKKAIAIITTSDNYSESSPDLKPYLDKCQTIIPGLEDLSKKEIKEPSPACKNLPKKFILFIGVLRHYKGLSTLIEACSNQNFHIAIAGKGPLTQELEKQAEHRKVDNITFLGYVSENDRLWLLKNCHALVLPSNKRAEGFGLVLIDGLMHGKPLITTEIGTGTSFINQSNLTGLVVEPNDAEQLRNALQTINSDDNQHQEYSKNARKRYEDIFTAENFANSFYEFLTKTQ